MHPHLLHPEILYRSHQDVLCKNETVFCNNLKGELHGMYPILDQCHIALSGQSGTSPNDPTLNRWTYDVIIPVMLVGSSCAQRTEVHLRAELFTPYPEEKMRYGCQLHCDCDMFVRAAVEIAPNTYRLTFDAHISLFSTQLRAG